MAAGWTQVQIDTLDAAISSSKQKQATSEYSLAMAEATGNTEEAARIQRELANATKLAAGWTQVQIDTLNTALDATIVETNIKAGIAFWQERLNSLTEEGLLANKNINIQRELADAVSETERNLIKQVYAQEDLTVAIGKATSAADFLNLALESIESTRISISNAFKAIEDNATQAAANLISAQESITSGYLSAQENVISAQDAVATAQEQVSNTAMQAADEMRGFSTSIKEFLLEMATTDLGANTQVNQMLELERDFYRQVLLARSGDTQAIDSITQKASALLMSGKNQFSTAEEFARFSSRIANSLSGISEIASLKAGPLTKTQASIIDPMVEPLKKLLEANQNLSKWSEAAAVAGATTEAATVDYLKEWKAAQVENIKAQKELKEAQDIVKGVNLELLDVLGELRVLMENYNKSQVDIKTAEADKSLADENVATLLKELKNLQQGAVTTATTATITQTPVKETEESYNMRLFNQLYEQAKIQRYRDWLKNIDPSSSATDTDGVKQVIWRSVGLSGLPSFDVGTNSVPSDMVATIHKGERIIPEADNTELMQRLSSPMNQDNSELVLEIQRLNTRLATIESNTASTAGHAAKTARLLDRAMPDGDAFSTREAAAI